MTLPACRFQLLKAESCVTRNLMRKWMRERIKRGGKKPSENLSESTGKIGQAIDPTKPSPLVPSYDSAPSSPAESRPRQQQADSAEVTERPAAPASVPARN